MKLTYVFISVLRYSVIRIPPLLYAHPMHLSSTLYNLRYWQVPHLFIFSLRLRLFWSVSNNLCRTTLLRCCILINVFALLDQVMHYIGQISHLQRDSNCIHFKLLFSHITNQKRANVEQKQKQLSAIRFKLVKQIFICTID